MPAAHLALEDVNREKNLLRGYRLHLHSNDSEVNSHADAFNGITMVAALELHL